jgi:hypothetical protein
MPAAAIIGAAAIGAGSSIVSGNKAAKAQKDAAAQQIAYQREKDAQDRADLAPWRRTGEGALAVLAREYGLSPREQGGPASAFIASPDYQFRLAEGNKAIERSAAARGLLGSGATLKAANDYAQNTASGEYGNWWNRMAGLAGVGQAATNTGIAAGQASTGNILNAYQQSGNARASSYVNTGSAINSGINNVLSAYLYQRGGGFGGER